MENNNGKRSPEVLRCRPPSFASMTGDYCAMRFAINFTATEDAFFKFFSFSSFFGSGNVA